MPSDANGVFSLPSGSEAVTGEVIQAATHNIPIQDLASAMSARLMRTGAAPMTGPLKIVDGSSGSPAVQFSNGSSTGFYKTTNGIGVSVNGTKVAEFNAGGVGRYFGELIPFTGLTAQALTVFPYGQTLSRTTYADLWAFAQTEIAGGNTFYNNGNGTTTFGVGDLRGRVVAGKDDMGGTAASRLTSATVVGTTLGAVGGEQTHTLTQPELPAVSPTFAGVADAVNVTTDSSSVLTGTIRDPNQGTQAGGSFFMTSLTQQSVTSAALISRGTFTPRGAISPLGSGAAHTNVQPTMICNYLLYAGA